MRSAPMTKAAVMLGAALVSVVLSITVSPAAAAARECKPPVLGDVAEAAREVDARRLALAEWKRRVAPLGKSYENWRMATQKRLACKPTADGTYRCAAYASPCRIRQNPRARPRPPRRAPGGRPFVIEA